MKKINFAMGIHFHQPVDNFDHVFNAAYEKSYRPFIDVLERYPGIKLTLHYSGSLLEWIEANRPELLKRIANLVARGQVEIMTGGFYEPILCVIPRRDSIGQVSMLTEYIKDRFHTEPVGMWLTERIWEPQLPSILHDAGIKYLIVDDTHLRYAGLLEHQLYGYYSTEDEGKVVYLFPSSERLRYSIPFREPHETIEYLRDLATEEGATEEGNRLLVYGDDGEKFGLWPETYNWVYNQRWLERFFETLIHESAWINITTLGEVLENVRCHGRVYIPTASYREMMEWSLPTESGNLFEEVLNDARASGKENFYKPFLRGGFWRNFLEKYPEANNMHKKMLRVSNKVAGLTEDSSPESSLGQGVNGSSEKNLNPGTLEPWNPFYIGKCVARKGMGLPQNIYEAHLELWRGQVNCPYWHGVFGGLYLGHLRAAVYRHLIKAEQIADDVIHNNKKGWIEVETLDFDCDGSEESVVTMPEISFTVDTHKGGMLTELDHRPSSYNILNTLARRPEVYHKKILANTGKGHSEVPHSIHDIVRSKEADLHLYLHYDTYRRGMLIDHIFANGTTLDCVIQNRYEDLGGFPWNPYTSSIKKIKNGKAIILQGRSLIHGTRICITKEINLQMGSPDMVFNYTLRNESGDTMDIWFGPEFNFAMLDGDSDFCKYYIEGVPLKDTCQRSRGENKDVSAIGIKNSVISTDINLSFSRRCILWRYPVETISQSENGFEREYQSSVLIPHWRFTLKEGMEWGVDIRLTMRVI